MLSETLIKFCSVRLERHLWANNYQKDILTILSFMKRVITNNLQEKSGKGCRK